MSPEFAYDGLSRRVQIVEQNATGGVTSTKNYLWIGQQIAEERSSTNSVTKRFFPQGEQQSGSPYYCTRDHLGSVRELISSTGTIFARYSYSDYGVRTYVQGSGSANFQYAGMYLHAASGLNLTLYRAYDPNTGRWLSRDPIGEKGGINLYGYALDDPIDSTDSSGLSAGPSCADGGRMILAQLPKMLQMCDCCVDKAKVGKCRQDAQAVVVAALAAWNSNYWPGMNFRDMVGGHLCWKWAELFADAVNNVGSPIWGADQRRFVDEHSEELRGGDQSNHFAARVFIKNPKQAGCEFNIDDGFNGDGLVHPFGWPPTTQNGGPNQRYTEVPAK